MFFHFELLLELSLGFLHVCTLHVLVAVTVSLFKAYEQVLDACGGKYVLNRFDCIIYSVIVLKRKSPLPWPSPLSLLALQTAMASLHTVYTSERTRNL